MKRRETQIGFSQRIRLEWFEQTVNLILAGNNRSIISKSLQDLLQDKVSVGSKSNRCNREKIITILLKTWLSVPRELETLRDEGLEILRELPRRDRIAVHWGMTQAAYPFWGAVAAAYAGRLLRLQGTAKASQVQRRVKEQYGERETVSRATQRVLRSFIDWGVLKETREKGVYAQGESIPARATPSHRLDGGGVSPRLCPSAPRPHGSVRHLTALARRSEHLSIPDVARFC